VGFITLCAPTARFHGRPPAFCLVVGGLYSVTALLENDHERVTVYTKLGACPRAHTQPLPTSRNRHALLLSYLTVSALIPLKRPALPWSPQHIPTDFVPSLRAQQLFKIVSCSSSRTFIIRPLTPSHAAFGIASFAIASFHFSV
jgi:hypothetical protein